MRRHVRLLSVLLAGLAVAGLLTIGFGLTPLSSSVFGSMFGLGPKGDFSLSSNSPVSVPQGHTGTISFTVTSINHLSGDVGVTATLTTSSNSPPVLATSQSSVKLATDTAAYFSLTISTTGSTSLGYYNITVQGRTSTLSHSITVSAQVTPPPPPPSPDFYLYSNTSSLTTTQGSSVGAVLTISSILAYSGTVGFTTSVYPSGVNSPRVSLNRTSLILVSGGSNATTLIVNTFNATIGTYTVSIYGISGSHSHTIDIMISVNHFVGYESLSLDASAFNSSTSVILYLRNLGSVTSSLVWYSVTDASGNKYVLTNWNGPVINPNQVGVAMIQIGSSCSKCVLYGSPFIFTVGYSYTITVVTRYGDPFTFTVFR